jgi:hypothetical protein
MRVLSTINEQEIYIRKKPPLLLSFVISWIGDHLMVS